MIEIFVAGKDHVSYISEILFLMKESAKVRGTGIAERTPSYLQQKIIEGKAVIALEGEKFVGFCYIESWSNHDYVANSGLIINPKYRGKGIARKVKQKAFELSRKLFPHAKLFGLTTSGAVMKINSELGYIPVPYEELTHDDDFWKGCKGCVNYESLEAKKRKMCFCTAMLYRPEK